MNVFACRDVLTQIMLVIDIKDVRNLAQVNKLSAAIPRLDYFWEHRYKREQNESLVQESVNYRKFYKYKSVCTNKHPEIYNIIVHQSVHSEGRNKFFTLQIKTRTRSEIYDYLAHLYNHENFANKEMLQTSVVRGLREANGKRFNEQDKKVLSDLYDQYAEENRDAISKLYYNYEPMSSWEAKSLITEKVLGFYGTDYLPLMGDYKEYNRIVLKFFDFLVSHNFRLDLNPASIIPPSPVTITPAMIKNVIKHSKECIELNKVKLITL